tara:strand:+ start:178 stop:831 length:654 start_codon:yes stop_codon:yes gene_type:complete
MTKRVLTQEILDQLEHDHPDALRSRADLIRINGILGNFRWLRKALEEQGAADGSAHVVEIGAGDGHFIRKFAAAHPKVNYTAIDLAPKPPEWPSNLNWKQGDALDCLPEVGGDILIANLFLHHLTDAQLAKLGEGLSGYRAVICNEPARFRAFHVLGKGVQLIGVNYVTRFDMHASINAGFRHTELPTALGLEQAGWHIEAFHSIFGIYRMLATQER